MGHQSRQAGSHQHADDVEPHVGGVLVVRGQPALGEGAQLAPLGRRHRLDRMPEADPPPGLDLAEDQGVGVPGDDVELALPAAPVAVEHPHADIGEVRGGDVLAEGAELESGGHPATVSPRRAAEGPVGQSVDGEIPCGREVRRSAGRRPE